MKLQLLTPWCKVLLEKLTGLQLVKKFPAFYGTQRFITALTSVRQLSLSWASPVQSTYPHPTSWRSILILSTHLRLGLPSGLFPSGFPNCPESRFFTVSRKSGLFKAAFRLSRVHCSQCSYNVPVTGFTAVSNVGKCSYNVPTTAFFTRYFKFSRKTRTAGHDGQTWLSGGMNSASCN